MCGVRVGVRGAVTNKRWCWWAIESESGCVGAAAEAQGRRQRWRLLLLCGVPVGQLGNRRCDELPRCLVVAGIFRIRFYGAYTPRHGAKGWEEFKGAGFAAVWWWRRVRSWVAVMAAVAGAATTGQAAMELKAVPARQGFCTKRLRANVEHLVGDMMVGARYDKIGRHVVGRLDNSTSSRNQLPLRLRISFVRVER